MERCMKTLMTSGSNSKLYNLLCLFYLSKLSFLISVFCLAQNCHSTAVPAKDYCLHSFHLEKVWLFTSSFPVRLAMPWHDKTPAIK